LVHSGKYPPYTSPGSEDVFNNPGGCPGHRALAEAEKFPDLLVKNGREAVFDQQIQEFFGFGKRSTARTVPRIIKYVLKAGRCAPSGQNIWG